MGWPTLEVGLIYSLTELFKLRQWPHTLGVETALLPRGLGPKGGILSWPWHPINPVPLCPITSTCLPPVLLYVALFPNCPYSLRITTNRWALRLVRLPLQLLNMFPFTIPVTLCSCPVVLTNTIRLGELATSITELTHCAAWTALVIGLPDPPSIAPYILQQYINLCTPSVVPSVQISNKILPLPYLCPILCSTLICTCPKSSVMDRITLDTLS